MNTLELEIQSACARAVFVQNNILVVELTDGRSVSVPLAWYPRLWYGAANERSDFEIIGEGRYIHWPKLDEDLSVAGILTGRSSKESSDSLKKWLQKRKNKKPTKNSPG